NVEPIPSSRGSKAPAPAAPPWPSITPCDDVRAAEPPVDCRDGVQGIAPATRVAVGRALFLVLAGRPAWRSTADHRPRRPARDHSAPGGAALPPGSGRSVPPATGGGLLGAAHRPDSAAIEWRD